MLCCNRASAILADLFGPEFILHRKMEGFCQRYPVGFRVASGMTATASGMLKPFLIPLIATLGLVLMPIKAAIAAHNGDVEGTKGYLKAWGVCLLTIVTTVSFFAITTYFMPLIWSSVLVVCIVALSVIFHVQKAMKEPEGLLLLRDRT